MNDTSNAVGAIVSLILFVAIAAALLWAVFGRDRYRKSPAAISSPGLQPTTEVFLDPDTGSRQRVWFDPATGVRDYRDDPDIRPPGPAN